MRISIDRYDPGYCNFRDYGAHRVFLNGVEQLEVVTADDELGEIIRLARDEHGVLIVERQHVLFELVRGKVRIETVCAPEAVSEQRTAEGVVGRAPSGEAGHAPT